MRENVNRFVEMGGVVDHNCFNFLCIIGNIFPIPLRTIWKYQRGDQKK